MWDAHKEDKERRRFVAEGLEKRPPVLAVAVFFLAMWLSGWACSALLLAQGMHSIPARYAISTLVSYGVFILSVGIWCRHTARHRKPGSGSGLHLGLDLPTAEGDGEGCLIVIAVLAVALLLSGIFWLVGGYALLFEVAFEAAFAGTMVYRMGRRDTLGNWAGTLIRRTWLPALVVGGILVASAAKMQHDYPEAKTLSQAVIAHRTQQK
jgi:hypothetical protein